LISLEFFHPYSSRFQVVAAHGSKNGSSFYAGKSLNVSAVFGRPPTTCSERGVLRDYAKQYLQWITHGTFEKRTVQSQILLGYLQLNDLGQCLEPGSGQGVEIVGKSLVPTQEAN
jgi:hypothetical protein